MPSVTCNVPVVVPDVWVGGEARPQHYMEHRYALSQDPVCRSFFQGLSLS